MYVFNVEKVNPFFKIYTQFSNGKKRFGSPYYIIPTISIDPYDKQIRNPKRYPEGCFDIVTQVTFIWLAWEFAITCTKSNYKILPNEQN